MPDHLPGVVAQKVPDLLVQIMVLESVETAVTSGLKSTVGDVGFSTSDAILELWFAL